MAPIGLAVSCGAGRPARRPADVRAEEGPNDRPVVALNDRAGDHARPNHDRFSPARVLAVPSIAYRLALAAAGEVDAGLSLTSGLDPYDIAGGHALLRAVGGDLVQLDGAPIRYGPHETFTGCIGGRPETVAALVRRKVGAGPVETSPRRPARPTHRTSSVVSLGRAQGALLGQLAGDALGSRVEFRSRASIAEDHPEGVRDLADGGTWTTLAGQPTDDGEMALALARALVATGAFDAEAVAGAYRRWRDSGPFDIGGTTAAGIAALAGRGRANAASESNGALMRVSPLGIFCAGDPARAARQAAEDAALTHPNPVCVAASSAFAAAIAAGVGGADPGAMIAVALAHAGDGAGADAVRRRIVAALDSPPARLDGADQGHVVLALANAVHRLHVLQPLEEAVIETVAMGGDTDTNAAIAGALIGAAQGRAAVPARWRNAVLSCRAVRAAGVRHPRPNAYWPDDALDLAEALLVAGQATGIQATAG